MRPGNMGPPDTKMQGSSIARQRSASRDYLVTVRDEHQSVEAVSSAAIISTASAMSSLLGKLNFNPMWFMAMPSHTR
jgi:hypothetical protein